MKYDVFIFTKVKVKVINVEAESQQQAIELAQEYYEPHVLFERELQTGAIGMAVAYTEWAEEDLEFLVDEQGDGSFGKSRWWRESADGIVACDQHEPRDAVEMTIGVSTGNAAVVECPELALATMLRKLADKIENNETGGNLRDENGNAVGAWEVHIAKNNDDENDENDDEEE